MTERICPKCGEVMRYVPEREYQLWDVHTIDAICPRCLHVETVSVIEIEDVSADAADEMARRLNRIRCRVPLGYHRPTP